MGRSEKKAMAFRYRPEEDAAPALVAAGKGLVAEKILQIAKEAGVPVLQDPAVVAAAAGLQIGDWIPEALFEAFVGILAGLYSVHNGNVDRRARQ